MPWSFSSRARVCSQVEPSSPPDPARDEPRSDSQSPGSTARQSPSIVIFVVESSFLSSRANARLGLAGGRSGGALFDHWFRHIVLEPSAGGAKLAPQAVKTPDASLNALLATRMAQFSRNDERP